MSTITTKKGGPYPKPVQDKIRDEVYHLYFEKGLSAVAIAEKLEKSRNTINEYVKFWREEISEQFSKYELKELVIDQLESLKNQRRRLLEMLEKKEEFKHLEIEKMIFQVEKEIAAVTMGVVEKRIRIPSKSEREEEVRNAASEEEAKRVLKEVALSKEIEDPRYVVKDDLLRQIVRQTGCSIRQADGIFVKLDELGLDLFADGEDQYNIGELANVRCDLSPKEKTQLEGKIKEARKKEEKAKKNY